MTITERTLKKWRMEALQDANSPEAIYSHDGVDVDFYKDEVKTLSERILRLTQELLDQHLLRKVTR